MVTHSKLKEPTFKYKEICLNVIGKYLMGIHNMYTAGEQLKYTLTSLYEITLKRKIGIF